MSWQKVIKSTANEEDSKRLLEIIKELETFKSIDFSGNRRTAIEALREYRREVKRVLRMR
jgi:Ran GTPase-activating protein (RanGAP) involved in mRNA processing and transport